jgi:sulfopyruvate decarboxylase TPP-binding subunit
MKTNTEVPSAVSSRHWSRDLFTILQDYGVRFYAYVPDAGNAALVQLAQQHPGIRTVMLTTEEEGVALCAGVDLVGQRGALLMQSSGVGNCGNFFTLIRGARFPIFMMVTMRGDYGETNPWQYAMGQAAIPMMESMGILPFVVTRSDDLERAAHAALAAAFKGGHGAALVLSQQFLGAKSM